MLPAVRRHLEQEGYRVYENPDGKDYFDLVARRGAEVGLVELKLEQGRVVLYQALRRRAWGDWTAVALAAEAPARRLLGSATSALRAPVGVWWVHDGQVEVLRPALRRRSSFSPPMVEARRRFDEWLDRVDRGEIPSGALWEGLQREVGRLSHGRRFREWTIEEAVGESAGEQR